MPPKTRLHKDKGKVKSIPKPTVNSNAINEAPTAGTSTNSADVERQFEVELVWCIQQLQTSLKSGKLNQNQASDATKLLNKLMNNTVPVIQKRQIMRVTFGDYRSKMAEEDKKFNKVNRQIKLVPVRTNPKSVFVKKSLTSTSDNSFNFNFEIPSEDKHIDDFANVKIEDNAVENDYRFEKSNNSFRFNFNPTD